MEKFLAMLKDVELNSQDKYISDLKRSGEAVGCFIPAWTPADVVDGMEIINQLYKKGVNLAFISVFDEIAEAAQKIDIDVPIISISEVKSLAKKPKSIIQIQSKYTWPDAIYQHFESQGIESFVLCDSAWLERMKTYYWSNIMDLHRAYQCLEDDVSRMSFLGVLKAKMTGQPHDRIYADEVQYLVEGFTPYENSVAIDGGAFDGETARIFSDLGADVYSFELDKKNYVHVEEKSKKYNFHAYNMGLWSCKKKDKYFSEGESSAIVNQGTDVAELIDIDTFVNEKNLKKIDYIKLDVEGAELEVLKGAAVSISKWKPRLAISAYHRNEDLWILCDYIKSIRPDYHFAFRHHRVDARDYYLNDVTRKWFIKFGLGLMVPTPWESILYVR